jgi:hypothetical protein
MMLTRACLGSVTMLAATAHSNSHRNTGRHAGRRYPVALGGSTVYRLLEAFGGDLSRAGASLRPTYKADLTHRSARSRRVRPGQTGPRQLSGGRQLPLDHVARWRPTHVQ